jgi:hypothetical protein
MGTFSIFLQGLSGETTHAKDDKGQPLLNKDGKPVILRKTLQLTYQVRGDEIRPNEDHVIEQGSEWVMR